MSAIRIQRKRTKGWRMPGNTVYVGRPSRWGNPFQEIEREEGKAVAAAYYEAWVEGEPSWDMKPPSKAEIRRELRGKNLACWCPLSEACHADVLLRIANEEGP